MYNYEHIKPRLFTEEMQNTFLRIRDRIHELLDESGAARMGSILKGSSGEGWDLIACVDRLVELGEIKEIDYGMCTGQDRIFVEEKK